MKKKKNKQKNKTQKHSKSLFHLTDKQCCFNNTNLIYRLWLMEINNIKKHTFLILKVLELGLIPLVQKSLTFTLCNKNTYSSMSPYLFLFKVTKRFYSFYRQDYSIVDPFSSKLQTLVYSFIFSVGRWRVRFYLSFIYQVLRNMTKV